MENSFNNDAEEFELKKIANKKVIKLKAFYSHAFIYAIGVIIFVLKEYAGFHLNFLPFKYLNCFVMIIWTTVFLVSAIDVFASFKIFGEEWEERKVKSILDKKNKKTKWE
ncbi:hypothetical protein B0A67_02040 [Flavobacterium aquidurense]|jgi:hypothetical protein|uniref:2TM domain-containing protein n=1 Tax=Flavobacterium aquidurense TaxID=362413 RepID=UPI0009227BC9|nr:2TM domain-containing protein [Flavobacterium aquidurense]OXA73860.1 hypothetical protein B0A67_02040 [Flavobacterium aquidurense]SHH38529.1 2TM domain-containing protein [Flavobacterium frigidimaris]